MRKIAEYLVLALVLVGVPLVACLLWGDEQILRGLASFPPRTEDWGLDPQRHWTASCPFSWAWFLSMAVFSLACLLPFLCRIVRSLRVERPPVAKVSGRFPWWGWMGLSVLVFFWVIAWTWQYFLPFQPHTYAPLWFGAIVTFNAIAKKRSGRCPLTDQTAFYLASFPISSLFWWFFEYLNRFVMNWYYECTANMSALRYLVIASICFSTVLPGIWAMAEALGTFRLFDDRNFENMGRVNVRRGWPLLFLTVVSVLGLVGVAVWPQYTYLLLWISPLMVFVLVQIVFRERCLLDRLREGSWGLVFRFSIAALACGFCWELWNWQSYVKWVYDVPYVYGLKIFEMPLIGFMGYIPFGIECAAVLHWMGVFGHDAA